MRSSPKFTKQGKRWVRGGLVNTLADTPPNQVLQVKHGSCVGAKSKPTPLCLCMVCLTWLCGALLVKTIGYFAIKQPRVSKGHPGQDYDDWCAIASPQVPALIPEVEMQTWQMKFNEIKMVLLRSWYWYMEITKKYLHVCDAFPLEKVISNEKEIYKLVILSKVNIFPYTPIIAYV